MAKTDKRKTDETDLAVLRAAREHRDREREAERTGGFLPSSVMLLHEVARLSDMMYRNADLPMRYSRRMILFHLGRNDGATQQELVTASRLTAATVSVEISSMMRDGLIEKKRDDLDHRCTRILLTERGRDTVERARAFLCKREKQMEEGLSDEEKSTLCQYLSRMRENLLSGFDEE